MKTKSVILEQYEISGKPLSNLYLVEDDGNGVVTLKDNKQTFVVCKKDDSLITFSFKDRNIEFDASELHIIGLLSSYIFGTEVENRKVTILKDEKLVK